MKKMKLKRFMAGTIAATLFLSLFTTVSASEDDVSEAINNATSSTIAEAVGEYLSESGNDGLYNILPECDKTEINERILKGVPYSDYAAIDAEYKKALEYTTGVDPDKYNKVFEEDFSDIDSEWTQTNIISGAIGNGRINGTNRSSLAITDEDSSFMFFGGAINPKNANYIERNIDNPKSVITMYLKVVNNNALSFTATFDGEQGICLKNTGVSVHTLPNTTIKDTGVDFSADNWNKIVFDGTSAGEVKCYVNGELAATYGGNITKLSVGTMFNFASYSVIAVDNITIAEEKPDTSFIDKFNSNPVTAESFSDVLSSESYAIFNKLPDCDKTELIAGIEKGKPYADKNEIKVEYEDLLIKVTQYDTDKYEADFIENFGNGITSAWESSKKPSVGSFLNNTVDSLNIEGAEEKSAIFWGASVSASNGEDKITGANQSIKKEIAENSRVSLYFWDPRNDKSAFLGIRVNDKLLVGAYGVSDNYTFSTSGDGAWKESKVAKSTGWHKVVFDGAEKPGMVSVYLDGELLATAEGTTQYLEIGNLWANAGYAYFAVDNITVARKFIPKAQNVKIKDRKTSLEAEYDYSHTGGVAQGETKFQWYKKNSNGDFEKIEGAVSKVYTYNFPDDTNGTFLVEITPVDSKGNTGDTVRSTEFTETYMSGIRPVVSEATISGDVFALSTLKAEYTATGATDNRKDKYKWFISEDGTQWEQVEGVSGSVYSPSTEIIGKKIKFAVSVAGRDGSYSEWFDSEIRSDETTLLQMISAVKGKTNVGRNKEMLDFLKLLDPSFNGYSVGHQQKIVIELFETNVSGEEAYRALVKRVLAENDFVANGEFEKVDGTDGIIVGNTGSGSAQISERFIDIDKVDWAKDAINALADKSIVSGKEARLFYPDDNVTRAEFVTMLVKAFFDTDYSAKQVFTDVADDAWYSPYVATAYAKGVVNGKDGGAFEPNEAITREEMAVLCARVDALGVCDEGQEREYVPFADENDISEYAYDSVVSMYKKSFINGMDNNRFEAKYNVTRAMAARIVFVMIKEEERYNSTGNYKTENFEDGLGIFKGGKPGDETVKRADESTMAYSGAGSIKIAGKSGVYTEVGDNKVFRAMIYDDITKNNITGMLSVGSYQSGVASYSKSARRENYSYVVNGSWKDAGITRTTGWHEFIIDMSRVGFVDFYIDGLKIAQVESNDENIEYVMLGNDWHNSTHPSYADEFRMARNLEELYNIKDEGYSNGNRLINNVRIDMSSVAETYNEAVGILSALEILSPDDSGKLNIEKKITKKEFAYLLCGMMNSSDYAKTATKSYYDDVTKNDRYAGYIQFITDKGLVEGRTDKFEPDGKVSADFAAKCMLKLLGYADMVGNSDSSWWINKAGEADIFKGVTIEGNALTIGDAIKVCYNTLFADMIEIENFSTTKMKYSISNEVTFMNYYFDLYYVDEYVNGVYGTELSDVQVLKKNEALLGDMIVKNYNPSLCEYNGMYIRAYIYVPESDDVTFVCGQNKGKSESVLIPARDINQVNLTGMKYDDGAKTRNVKFNSALKVIYNGAHLFGYTEKHLKPHIGYVRFVDRDSDGVQDIAFVMDYKAVKISAIDKIAGIIYDEYTDAEYNLSNAEKITRGIYRDFSIESLSEGVYILFAQSECLTRADILTDTVVAEGQITGRTDEYVYIDGEEYYSYDPVNEYFDEKGLSGLSIGTVAEFIIDSFGNVIGMDKATALSEYFGYAVKISKDEEENYMIKMYTDLGLMQKASFAEKVKYNGESIENLDKLLEITPQLVRVRTKSDGTINSIETAKTNYINSDELKGSEEFWVYRDVTNGYYRDNGYHFGLTIRTSADTPIMFVPPEEHLNDETKYRMGTRSSLSNGQSGLIYKAYNADEFNFPEIIVMQSSSSGNRLLKSNETPLFVVSKRMTEVDENDEITDVVYGFENGEARRYVIADDFDVDAFKQDKGYVNSLEVGDTFIPAVNGNEEITELRYIVRMEEASDKYSNLASWNYVMDHISCCYAQIDRYGAALRITDGINSIVLSSPERVYVYNITSKTITIGNGDDLIKGRDIAIRTCHGNTREVIVYVD